SRADKLGDPFEGSWPKINVIAQTTVAPPDLTPEQCAGYFREMSQIGNFTKAKRPANPRAGRFINTRSRRRGSTATKSKRPRLATATRDLCGCFLGSGPAASNRPSTKRHLRSAFATTCIRFEW